jgi:hypothetical protein
MGTLQDWLRVVLFGAFWSGVMVLLDTWKRGTTGKTLPAGIGRFWYSMAYVFGGLMFGMVLAFHWREFYGKLGIIFAAVVSVGILSGHFFRRSRRVEEPPLPS